MKGKKYLIFVLLIFTSRGVFANQSSNTDTLNTYDVYRYIKCSGILHPEIVLRQAIWETGWFKSKHSLHKNNLFGFRYKEYLRFESWQKSIDYYAQWQQKRYKDMNEDYYAFLKRIRYGSASYPDAVKRISYTLKCPCTE